MLLQCVRVETIRECENMYKNERGKDLTTCLRNCPVEIPYLTNQILQEMC